MAFRLRFSAVLAGLIVVACQTAPEAPAPEPVAEEVPAVELPPPPSPDEPRLNEWGGEVPENKPAGDVDEDRLGDLP